MLTAHRRELWTPKEVVNGWTVRGYKHRTWTEWEVFALDADGYQIAGQDQLSRKADAIQWAQEHACPPNAVQ
jgi:hypothetical protein